jgi:thioredoxin 1
VKNRTHIVTHPSGVNLIRKTGYKLFESDHMTHSLSRRTVLCGVASLAATASFIQSATARTEFSKASFEAAQAAGKPIIVEVSATWCPVCKAQAPILASLRSKPEYRNVAFFEIDFDTQKDALQSLKVIKQSTLIAFKGKAETSRSTGDTTAAGIEKLFKSAI